MHEFLGMNNFAAKSLTYTLMTEADSQYGDLAIIEFNERYRYPRLAGRARSGGNDDARGLQPRNFIRRNLIVTKHYHLFTQLAKILH